MFKHAHAARFCLPLFLSLGATVYGQTTNRPSGPPPVNTTPVVTQPLSKTKHVVTIADPSLTSAPLSEIQKAFRALLGREGTREEISVAPVVQMRGDRLTCQPSTQGNQKWDCETPIRNWLYTTAEGRGTCLLVHIRASKEVFGIQPSFEFLGQKYHPCEPQQTSHGMVEPTKYGYAELVGAYLNALYAAPSASAPPAATMQTLGGPVSVPIPQGHDMKNPFDDPNLKLDAVIKRAFQTAVKRPATDADVKALSAVFATERATYVRMVEVIQGFDSLKNIK